MTDQHEAALEQLLRLVPYFRDLDRVSLARVAGALERVSLPQGSVVTREGSAAQELYLLESGAVIASVHAPSGSVDVGSIMAPGSFGEMGLLLSRRTATVQVSSSEATMWRLPRERFEQLVRERPDIALAVAASLADTLDKRQRDLVGAPQLDEAQPMTLESRPRASRARLLGAALAILVPLVLAQLAPPGRPVGEGVGDPSRPGRRRDRVAGRAGP